MAEAYTKAFNADSVSAFGGIVVLNQTIDLETAEALTKTFLECVVAPGCNLEAQTILKKKSKLRILVLPDLQTGEKETVKAIAGGLLVQKSDDFLEDPDCLLYTSPSPRDLSTSRMPSSA